MSMFHSLLLFVVSFCFVYCFPLRLLNDFSNFCLRNFLRAVSLIAANFPAMKEIAMEFVDVIFVPKVIGRQLALAVALQTGLVRI
jgi:hypothetical protein